MKSPETLNNGDGRKLVMIVDDEPDMLSMLRLVIEKKCSCDVISARSGLAALEQLQKYRPEVVLSDIKMPDLDGLELLKRIQHHDATISVVIMTGYGTIDMAVQALKDGAYDFLQKPFDKDHIVRVIRNGLERTALMRVNDQLRERLNDLAQPEGFIGQSPALKRVLDLLSRVADTDATVLIRGESGTGKELAARALHNLSNRKKRQMITVNCPALPENVLESELFGYSKGAFTGAMQDKKGLFLEANSSTILLDEIADIPVSIQTKLLRVLQEKEIQPLGQNKTMKVDVRVVASTNQDLEAKIRIGEFREDLFYRLNVVSAFMPSLEEIREDIPLLVHHFLAQFKRQYDRENLVLSPDVLQHLCQRKWPGNVRELQNNIKRIVLLAVGDRVNLADISAPDNKNKLAATNNFDSLFTADYNDAKAEIVSRFSIDYLHNLLTRHEGNVTNAAAGCGLERQALQRIMRRYGVVSTDFKAK
ncbi:sigma-54-dependent Fis family transcriptional regulator [Desulfopila sp. IMCC35006]|uniref:sigma-54-dependent transcriptional regulator n=1 Tax=Desulfopila sp. IMCC35006 TaxID=2569542 RepID=UPI0010AC03E2|nr:sigma-54 dependent transcriptional regulator [Desulfopila sp. IMCC35006]TKB24771.1 sigma-54-dependent Fis family transcriptional regulator [Desulfopila sp. IMCC35006]